jgi:hypothetical protein
MRVSFDILLFEVARTYIFFSKKFNIKNSAEDVAHTFALHIYLLF